LKCFAALLTEFRVPPVDRDPLVAKGCDVECIVDEALFLYLYCKRSFSRFARTLLQAKDETAPRGNCCTKKKGIIKKNYLTFYEIARRCTLLQL